MSKIFTITGPSGSGKDTIADGILYLSGNRNIDDLSKFLRSYKTELQALKAEFPEVFIKTLVSHTTRSPRPGEKHGVNYYYITKEEFDNLPKVEETYYSGNYYCLSQDEVKNTRNGIVVVDIEGVKQVKAFNKDTYSFYIMTSPEVIEKRMEARGDTPEKIAERLKFAETTGEYNNADKCDHVIINDNIISTLREVYSVIVNKINN